MNINPTLVNNDGEVTAHATVTRDRGIAQKGVTVRFNVDGRDKNPVVVNNAGHATLELGKLGIGVHIVTAEVIGITPTVAGVARIRIDKKTRQPTGTFGRTMMVLFWAIALFVKIFLGFGPGFLLTGTYLVLTAIVLFLISRNKGVSFGSVIGNNNWVFGATIAMAIFSGIMGYFNPLVPESVGGGWWNWLWSETELSDSVFWGVINGWFFGESFTYGWNDAMVWFILCIVPSALISFTDELTGLGSKWAKHQESGGGFLGFAREHLAGEFLVQAPAKAILKMLGLGK